MTEYYKIGKFVASFGLGGELILKHNLGKKSTLKDVKAVFTEEKNESFLPWFIESAKARSNDEMLVKIEGINTKEGAARLAQKEAWLTEADFKNQSAKSAPINLLGYEVVENKNVLGKIEEVIEQPHQLLCRIQYRDNEAYIPLHPETIVKIDNKNRRVIVSLPDGLLDIYSQA